MIREDNLFMCADCYRLSGEGKSISITYSNTGGWSPAWEGRLCLHLKANEVLSYLRGEKKDEIRGTHGRSSS